MTIETTKFGLLAVVLSAVMMGCGVGAVAADGTGDETLTTSDELRKKDPCYVVRCTASTHCESKGQKASCVPNPVSTACTVDSDCQTFSNYCNGCSCQALSTSSGFPACNGTTVNCFADPCMNKTAVCSAGSCITQ
jgi:hypothetical protein